MNRDKIIGKWGRDFFIKFGKEYDRHKNIAEPKFWWIKIFPWIRVGVLWTRNINSPIAPPETDESNS